MTAPFAPRDPELVAARFAAVRSGYRLATFGEVGLPVYWLKVRSLVLTPTKLPASQVFLLHTVNAGLSDPSDIASFLGLEQSVVNEDLTELLRRDDLAVSASSGESHNSLRVSPKGLVTLIKEASEFPEERTLWFGVDSTTSRVVVESSATLLQPPNAKAEGLRLLATLGPRPELGGIDRKEVQQAFERATGRRQKEQSILSFLEIEDRHMRFIPAVALVYRGATEEDVQVAFAIDGHLSAIHEEAFAKLEGAGRCGLLKELAESGREPPQFPELATVPEFSPPPLSPEQEQIAADALLHREEERLASESEKEAVSDQERRTEESRARDAGQKAKESERKLGKPTIRRLSVFEHPPLLRRAIDEARTRLLLISPWIAAKVVDQRFLDELRATLERRVLVYLGYGLQDGAHTKEPSPIDKESIRELERLARRYSNFTFRNFGNVHSKILLMDTSLAVYTSFNWLSFRGDPRRPLREETGVLITIPEKVDQFFSDELVRFEATTSR